MTNPEPPVWCSEHMEPYCPRHAALDSVPRHTRATTDTGPDYCRECSEAAQEWVKWPCSDTLSEPPGDAKGCRHIELPDTLWKRLREAEEKAEEEYRRGFDEGVRRLDLLRREQATPESPSGGDRLRERLRLDAEVEAKRPAHEKRHMPAIAESMAPTSQNPSSGDEVTADELAEVIADGVVAYFKTISYLADTSDEVWADEHEIAKHGQARRSAAAILARYDVRSKP